MRYGSVCSGVEAATLAWHHLGWKPVFFSEVEPFPCAVLQERLGASAPINPLATEEATSEPEKNQGGNVIVDAVAIAENVIGRKVENGGNGVGAQEELAYTQNATGVMGVSQNMTVRRLLPIECERLMGFPDNWTQIPWRGKPAEECPDAPRYKACGNSMCVNVMQWIGEQIERVEKEMNENERS